MQKIVWKELLWFFVLFLQISLRKHAYSNILKISPPKTESLQIKHYENTPIQIYWKFHHQKNKSFQIKILIFFIFLLKT